MNVIFIDDDEDLNFLQDRMCARSKAISNYYIASSAIETLQYLSDTNIAPDVIFVDINMPVMNGFQFIEEFEQHFAAKFPDTQIYVLSSSVRSDDRRRSFEYKSVKDFIIKPMTEEQLLDICYQQVNSLEKE
ncbi:MAG TPA: response regulator [Cyclobacteriaceae bacterium]|nr:response regulator [Cyclobacteriaceae bacterium]